MPLVLRTSPSFWRCASLSKLLPFLTSWDDQCKVEQALRTTEIALTTDKLNNDVFPLAVKSNCPLQYFPTWPFCFILSDWRIIATTLSSAWHNDPVVDVLTLASFSWHHPQTPFPLSVLDVSPILLPCHLVSSHHLLWSTSVVLVTNYWLKTQKYLTLPWYLIRVLVGYN